MSDLAPNNPVPDSGTSAHIERKIKPLEYSGELYSEEHNYKFTVERVTVQITPDPTDKRKLQLNIGKIPFVVWCKRLNESLKSFTKQQSKSNGFKL